LDLYGEIGAPRLEPARRVEERLDAEQVGEVVADRKPGALSSGDRLDDKRVEEAGIRRPRVAQDHPVPGLVNRGAVDEGLERGGAVALEGPSHLHVRVSRQAEIE